MTDHIEATDVVDRATLVTFVDRLSRDLAANEAGWENVELTTYLEAMAAWIRAIPALEKNTGQDFESMSKWQLIAAILDAARIYE